MDEHLAVHRDSPLTHLAASLGDLNTSARSRSSVDARVHTRGAKSHETGIPNHDAVIDQIDRRVKILQGRSNILIVSIAMSLVITAGIVLFAGKLTSIDASAVSNMDKLNAELSDANRQLGSLLQQEANLDRQKVRKEELERMNQRNKAEDDELEYLRRQLSSSSSLSAAIPNDSAALSVLISNQRENISKISKYRDEAWEKERGSEHGYNDWRYIIATAITRVGVIVVIVFLVQILMGLYRYNTRLITYYNSRRDLITLWDGRVQGLKVLDQTLTPPNIDFGKEPKHPLEDLIKAIDTYTSSENKRGKSKTSQPKPALPHTSGEDRQGA